MENQQHIEQYNLIPNEELNEQPQNYEVRQKVNPYNICLLLICGFSTVFGSYLLYEISLKNQNQPHNCMITIKIVKYYSQYLMLDAVVQIIILVILCLLMPIKKYDIKNQVDRQISFEFFDQLIIFFVLIVMIGIPQDCINVKNKTIILLYSFLIYFVVFLLAIQKYIQ